MTKIIFFFLLNFTDVALYDKREQGEGAKHFEGRESVDNLLSFNC